MSYKGYLPHDRLDDGSTSVDHYDMGVHSDYGEGDVLGRSLPGSTQGMWSAGQRRRRDVSVRLDGDRLRDELALRGRSAPQLAKQLGGEPGPRRRPTPNQAARSDSRSPVARARGSVTMTQEMPSSDDRSSFPGCRGPQP
jgi:hypothetical protein